MTALFGWLLSYIGPKAIGILAAVVAALAWGFRQRLAGAAAERAKQAKAMQAAAEDRHEMDREATEAERKAKDLTDAEAIKEALSWRKS